MPLASGGPTLLHPLDDPLVGGNRPSTTGPAAPAGALWMWAWVVAPSSFWTDRSQQTGLCATSTVIFAVPVAVDLSGGVSVPPTSFVTRVAPALGVGELGALARGAGGLWAGGLLAGGLWAYPLCPAPAKGRMIMAAATERRPRLILLPPRDLSPRRPPPPSTHIRSPAQPLYDEGIDPGGLIATSKGQAPPSVGRTSWPGG